MAGIPKELMRLTHEQIYEENKDLFISLGKGGHYTESQKQYAFELINEHGMRATARILKIPRRTLQRWCRQYGIYVRRCPGWKTQEEKRVLETQGLLLKP